MPIPTTPYTPDGLPAALALLLGPALPSTSACRGQAPLHDDTIHGELADEREQRHARAVCAGCPARAVCAAVANDPRTLDPLSGVAGVLGGELVPDVGAMDRRRRWAEHTTRQPDPSGPSLGPTLHDHPRRER